MEPKYPVNEHVAEIDRRYNLLCESGFEHVIFVFDGKIPPSKQRKTRQKCHEEMEDGRSRMNRSFL